MPNPKIDPNLPVPNIRGADPLAEKALLEDDTPVYVPALDEPTMAPVTTQGDKDAGPPKEHELTPAERWRKTIAAASLDEAKANKILDSFLDPGYYHEDFTLLNGRIKVTFRTREPENTSRVIRALGRLENPTQTAVNETTALYNFAGAIKTFWKKGMKERIVFPFPTSTNTDIEAATMFDDRMKFIMNSENIAAPLMYVFYTALTKFDQQVSAALSEGAESGF